MTIKDIAKLCGVSVSTVSRALNNRPDVSQELRKKILEVVEANNYIPNNSARDLVKSQSDAIGVVTRGIGNPFFSDMLKTITREIDLQGYTTVLRQIGSDEDEIKAGAVLEREKKLQGLLFLGGRFDYTPEELTSINVPFVCCSYTNGFGTLQDEEYASVSIDDQEAAFQAVNHLIALGHKRIAALVPSCSDRSISELRYNGYRAALFAADVPFDKELLIETGGSFELEDAYAATKTLLSKTEAFTALFVVSDTMAMAAIKALSDSGFSVPGDVSVIAIDGLRSSEYIIPTLTTMVQPTVEMGRESVKILMDMVKSGEGPRHCRLEPRMRPGGSVSSI